MSKLAGKVAVVTGASKGIGASIAEQLAADGASVVVNYASSKAGADKVVNAITAKGGKAIAVQADVSSETDIKRLFAETKKAYGKVDILVNNAGIYEFLPLENITAEHFHKQYNLNVLGLLLTTQEAVKLIPAEGGSIINIGSVVAQSPVATGSVYSSTKAAVDAITIALSKELGPRKIRVNSVNPGMVETEGFHAAGIAESDFRQDGRSANSTWPHRPAARYRYCGFLRSIRRCRLGQRTDHLYFRRHALSISPSLKSGTAPPLSRSAPSPAVLLLRSTPQRYPVSEPSLPTTRWQGITTASGFDAHARATARTAVGCPISFATSA